MKLDKEFKNDVNKCVSSVSYLTRSILTRIVIGIGAIALVAGVFKVGYTYTIGKQQTNAEREVFKNTIAYTEQTAQNLAKYYKEYNEAETEEDKKAIQEYVVITYPNINTETIDNQTLRQFYVSCLN